MKFSVLLSVAFYVLPVLFADELGNLDLLEDSRLWPHKVTVNKEVVGQKHGNVVPGGREWIFIRYVDGKCLVDMGHNGVFSFEPSETDVLARVLKNKDVRTEDFQGLFTHRFTKFFFDPRTLKGLQYEGPMETCEYFLVFFFDYLSDQSDGEMLGDFTKKYQQTLLDSFQAGILLAPEKNIIEAQAIDSYLTDGFVAPTIAPYKYKGFLHAMYYDPKRNGDVLLVDKYGRLVGQFFIDDLSSQADEEMLFRTVSSILNEDRL